MPGPPRPRRALLLGGLALGLGASLALELRFNHFGGILEGRYAMMGVLGAWWAAFALAAWCLFRLGLPRRTAVVAVLAAAVVFQLAALTAGPQLSDDLYRYAWDGRVQAAGTNPYRYPPDDARVAGLRDSWLWPPPEDCADIHRAPGCTRLNRPGERTIYPPVGQVWFRFLDLVLPAGSEERGLQVAHALVGLALAGVLAGMLAASGRDPARAALYAWSPLAVVETAMDAHVDVLAALVSVAALGTLSRRREGVAGALVGAAAAIKLIPGLLVPAMLRSRPLRVVTGAALVVGVAYLPHVVAVGPKVLGYLPDYLQEEEYGRGNRFLLLRLLGLGGTVAQVVAVLLVVGAAVWVAWPARGHPATTRARWLLVVAFLVATPVQPWYALLLVAVALLDGAWEALVVAAAAYPLYFATVLDGPAVGMGMVSYGVAALVVVAVEATRRRGRTRTGSGSTFRRPVPGAAS